MYLIEQKSCNFFPQIKKNKQKGSQIWKVQKRAAVTLKRKKKEKKKIPATFLPLRHLKAINQCLNCHL